MNTKKTSVLVVLLLAFTLISNTVIASATTEEGDNNNRYFIQTTKGFWKSTLGVRNSFGDGFTSDLSDWQLRLAKIAGIKVYPVKKLNILPGLAEVVPAGSKARGGRVVPPDQVAWGVDTIYGSLSSEQPSGGKGVKVAVLDTGVMADHPDLKARIIDCKDFSGAKSMIDGKCEDRNGHGTHVAGIILADGGSDHLGIYGVAPEASLLAYKVCSNSGSCWSDDIANAIYMATDSGANIMNLSLGSDTASSLISDAIDYAVSEGVLVVAAAGNDGPYTNSIDYPGALKNVVAVGAVDKLLVIPDWSSRGINSETDPVVIEEGDIELAAPGVGIVSTWKDGGYANLSGTSMATPHIAGLAAKIWKDATETMTSAEATRQYLHDLAIDLAPDGDDNSSGYGMPAL